MGLGGGSRLPFLIYIPNLDFLRAGDAGDSGTIAGACVSLVGLCTFDGWEVAATAAA